MSRYLYTLLFIPLIFVLGCARDDEPNDMSSNAEYYVKYEAIVESVYIGNSIKYTVNTDKGSYTFTTGKTFSQTFGPFNKGFRASITADASSWNQAKCDVRIYVCRGSEPFALKANNYGDKKASVSYTIDY